LAENLPVWAVNFTPSRQNVVGAQKGVFMKNFFKARIAPLFSVALAALIVCGVTACPDGSNSSSDDDKESNPINVPNGGSNGSSDVPSVTSLPDFPIRSQPAATTADARQVLEELRESGAIYLLTQEIRVSIWDYVENELDVNWDKYNYSYSFNNQSISGANLKVSASVTESDSVTGGFKAEEDLRDRFERDYGDEWWVEMDEAYEAERANIRFAVNDREKWTYSGRRKGEVTANKLIQGVTIARGSTFEETWSGSGEETVTKAGTNKTARSNYSESEKDQIVIGCTVTTASGSIKIVLDITGEESASARDVSWDDDYDENNWTSTTKGSGFLKIYGANNAVLIDKTVNDYDDYDEVLDAIGYYYDWDDYSLSVRGARTIVPKR